MAENTISIHYESFASLQDIANPVYITLVEKAREITQQAYAPYSNFLVGAAALLSNGAIVTGTNQENASYPVTICAERTLLAAAASLHNGQWVEVMAISYKATLLNITPISPCGMCRQALLEHEQRFKRSIKILLSAQQGEIILLHSIADLLPFAFKPDNLLGNS